MPLTSFSGRLKYARERLGLTQAQVAMIIGTTQSRYHPWESGAKGKGIEPDYGMLIKLSDALGVSIEWLIRGDGEKQAVTLSEPELKLLGNYRIGSKLGIGNQMASMTSLMVREASQNYGGSTQGKEPRVAHHKRRAG